MSNPSYNPYASGNQNSIQGQNGLSNTQAERDPQRAFLGPGSRSSSSGASAVIPQNFGGSVASSLNYRPETSRALRDEYTMTSASASLGHEHGVESDSSTLNWPSADGSISKSSSALSNYASIADDRLKNPDEKEHSMQTIPGLGDYDLSASDKPAAASELRKPRFTSETAAKILLHFGLEKEDLEFLISYPEDQMTPANLPFILNQIRLRKFKSESTEVESKPYLEPQPTQIVSGVDSYSLSSSGGAVMHQKKTSSPVLQSSMGIDYGHSGKYKVGLGVEVGMRSDRDNNRGSGNVFTVDDAANRNCREPLQKKATEFKSSEQAGSFTSLGSSCSSVLSSTAPSSEKKTQLRIHPNQTIQDTLSSFPLPKKDTAMRVYKSEAPKPVPLNQQEVDCQSTLKTKLPHSWPHGIHPSRPGLVLIGSNEPNRTFQDTLSSFPVPKKDTAMRVYKSEAPKPVPLNQQEVDCQSTLKTKLPYSRSHGIHPSRPGLVLIGSNEPNQTFQDPLISLPLPKKDTDIKVYKSEASKPVLFNQQEVDCQSTLKTQLPSSVSCGIHPSRPGLVLSGSNDASNTKEASKPKGKRSVVVKYVIGQKGKQTEPIQHHSMQLIQKQPVEQAQEPPVQQQQSKKQTVPPQKLPVSEPGQAWIPGDFEKSVPATGVIPGQMNIPTFKGELKDEVAVSKDQPSPEMLYEAIPKIFPHTCSLCNKECTDVKDWTSHKFSVQHQRNSSKLLRKQGEVNNAKPSTSTSAKKTRHGSRSSSKSISPHPQSSQEGKRSRRRSRSQPPQRSRFNRRYSPSSSTRSSERQSRSRSPERRSHSRSPKRRSRSSERRSRSRSPKRRSRSSERRSRSRSPKRRSRSSERRSRSRSPKRRPWSPERRSRSRSPKRRSSTRRKDDRLSPPRKSHDRRSPLRKSNETRLPSRKADDRRSPPWWSNETRSPKRRSNERQSSPGWVANRKSSPRKVDKKYSPPWRSDDRCSPPRRVDKKRSPPGRVGETSSPARRVGKTWSPSRKSDESRSPRSQERRSYRERSSPPRKGSDSAESLAKKILKTSAVQSLPDPTDMESVVKSLAPALLAELAKMTPSTSPLSGGHRSSPPSSRNASCSTELQVKLRHVPQGLSHANVAAAMDYFGKTKSVTLYRSRQEATVVFEKVEDAEKLKRLRSICVRGKTIVVVKEKLAVTEEQIMSPSRTPATRHTTSYTKTATTTGVRPPTPNIPPLSGLRLKRRTTGKVSDGKKNVPAAVVRTVNRAKVLVSKAKIMSIKRVSEAKKEKKAKQGTSLEFKTTSPETQPDTGDSKHKPVPEKSMISIKGPGVGLKDTDANRTVGEPAKGPSLEEKVLASQAETQKPQTQEDKLAESAAETAGKGESAPSRCVSSESPPHGESLKLKRSDTKGQESSEVRKNTVESVKVSPPTMVKLQGIDKSLSHCDMLSAAEHFGKTKSVVLFRARSEAIVIFEKGEDAKKLKMAESLDVNGRTIPVIVEKETVSKEKTPPQKKHATFRASKLEASVEKILPSSPVVPKGVTTVAEGKVFASDATRVSAQQIVTTGTLSAEGDVKTEVEKQETSLRAKNQPDAGDSSQRPVHGKSKSIVKELVVRLKDEPIAPEPAICSVIAARIKAVSTTQKPKTPSKALSNEMMAEDMTVLSNFEASKEKPASEKSDTAAKGGGVERINTKEVDKSANSAARSMSIEQVVLASKGEAGSTGKKPKTRVDELAEPGAGEDASAPSRSADTQNQPHGQSVKVNQSEIKFHESLEVPKETAKIAEKEHVTVSKHKDRGKAVKKDDADEPMELGGSGGQVAEPVEVGICAEGKVEETTNSKAAPEKSADNPRESQPPTSSVQNQPTETSVKASTQVQGSPLSEPAFTTQGPKTRTEASQEQQQAAGSTNDAHVEEAAGNGASVPSRSAHPQNQPQGVKLEQNEIKIQESLEVPKDTAKVVFEHKGQEKTDGVHDAEEPMDLGVSGAKVAEVKGGETTPEAVPVNSRPQTVETQPTETSVKASTQVQQRPLSEPESSARGPDTRTEASREHQQAAGSTEEAAVEAVMPGGGAETKTTQHEDDASKAVVKVSAVSSEVPSAVKTKPTAAAESVQKPAACKRPSRAPRVTVGEMLHDQLYPHRIRCVPPHFVQDSRYLPYGHKTILIFGLPVYNDWVYTEWDVAKLLNPFGLKSKEDSLYVIPQSCMAFVTMPSMGTVLNLIRESVYNGIFFRGQRLRFAVISFCGQLRHLSFYTLLKKVLNCCLYDEAERTVLIRNITRKQISDLREALNEFGPVTNFTPLLNKLYVEFEFVEDAERFGLWHSQQKRPFGHIVIRLKGQTTTCPSLSPVPAVATQSGAASAKDASKTAGNVSAVMKEKVPTMQKPGISEETRLAAATVTKDRVAGDATAVPSKSEAPEKQPGAGVPKTKAIPDKSVTGVKGPGLVGKNETAQIQKSENRTKSELAKGPLVKAKALASKGGMVTTIQKAKKSKENQAETGAASHEKIAKDGTVPSKDKPSENLTDAGDSKLKPVADKSDTRVKEPVVGLVETSVVDKLENRTITELGKSPLVGQRVLEIVSTTQKPETPSGNLAVTEAVSNERIAQDVTKALENQPGAGDPKLNPEPDKPVANDKEPKVGLKETANVDSSENRTETAKGPLVKAKVSASIEEIVLTTKKPETPSEKASATETGTCEGISKDVTEASETKPGLGDSKEKPAPGTSGGGRQGPKAGQKETEDVHESAQITNSAPVKGPLIEEKVFVSKAGTVSTTQKPETTPETPPAAEDMTVPSKSEASENLPDTIDSKEKPTSEKSDTALKGAGVELKDTEEVGKSTNRAVSHSAKRLSSDEQVLTPKAETLSTKQEPETQVESFKVHQDEIKIHKSLDVPKETAKVIQKENVTVFEHWGQEQIDKAHDAEEPMELGVSGAKVGEGGGEETSSKAAPVKSTDEPKDSRPQTVEIQPTDTSVKASTQVRESPLSDPGSSARGPDTRTEASREHQQAAGSTEEAAVEAETKTTQHDPLTKETTQMDSTSTKTASRAVGEISAVSQAEPTAAASKQLSSSVTPPTIGEMLEKYLFPHSIHCLPTANLSPSSRQLFISGLPTYDDGSYTEDDVANLLVPYKFHDKEKNLYVIPQTCMAFATMPRMVNVINIMRDSVKKGISFRGKRLLIQVVCKRCPIDQLQFYTLLKKIMKCSVIDEAERTVFIRNISPSEIRELREALKEFGPVTNFMPLLNKLFIELPSITETERFADWYGLLNHAPGHKVLWTKMRGYQRHSGPAATLKTQTDASSDQDSSVTSGKMREKRPAEEELANDAPLTFGERFEKQLTRSVKASLMCDPGTSPKMLITWRCDDDVSYTEDDFIRLLTPFGYQHRDHNIYVVPQARLAFVLMPTARSVFDIIRASKGVPIILKGSELCLYALNDTISMSPSWFYKSLMELLKYRVDEHNNRLIFIRDISPSETRELREALTKVRSVRNFLPLLNKVFLEFHTPLDADQLGVWFSLLKQPPAYRIQRLEIPSSKKTVPPPVVPKNSLLGSKDLIEGVTIPSAKVAVPQFSTPPFWITLRKGPFVFPTISPWFIIPEHVTVRKIDDIKKAACQGTMCPTIMLTGLPEEGYTHEDVARLVWPYFPKQTLHSLYYNVTVLPLQRRAFVFFSDWTTCCDFVKAHIAKWVSIKGRTIGVHFVLQDMYPDSSEETMYRSLMKWSNAGVPDPTSLEERLLCVEVSEVSLDVITLVIEMVASITTFVNFMPLSNRICVEMTDSSGVTKVVEKYNESSPSSFTEDPAWSKVKHFEPLESLKRRLQDSGEVTINIDEPDAIVGKDESSEIDKDMLKAITVTVGENRLVQQSRSQSVEKKGQDDFTDGRVSSGAYLSHDKEEFVTVDEVYDDVKDSSLEPCCYSPTKHSSRERRESHSSGVSPSRQQTSTRSSKDSSSRSKDSSQPTKSSTKSSSSSSSSASKASSPSPPVSTESPSSLDQNHPDGSSAPQITGSQGGQVVDSVKDEGKVHPGGHSKMDVGGPLQVRDSVTKDGAATSQEDSGLVQREGSTLKQLSEEGSGPISGKSADKPAVEDDAGKKRETNTEDTSKQFNTRSKSTYKVIDSVEDQPKTTESDTQNKQQRSKRGEAMARRDDRPSRRSNPTSKASINEEERSPRKPDRTNARYETRRRMDTTAENELIQSSTESSGRRRSTRGKKEDKVKEEAITTRSTRGKTARTTEDASTGKTKEKDTATRRSLKKHSVSQEDQSEDGRSRVRKQIQTVEDAGCDKEDKSNEEPTRTTLRSGKRKLDNDTDEVKEEETRTTPRTRGRPKKRTRLTPVRKSPRQKEEPSSLKTSSSTDGTLKVQRTAGLKTASEAESASASVGLENKTLEGCLEEKDERSRADMKVGSKKRRGAVGPEAKRSRSQSPSVPDDFKLPELKPDNPLGNQFVVPAYFCNLCSVFYHESTSEEPHCSSQTHLHNLQKHYEELQQKSAGSSSKS